MQLRVARRAVQPRHEGAQQPLLDLHARLLAEEWQHALARDARFLLLEALEVLEVHVVLHRIQRAQQQVKRADGQAQRRRRAVGQVGDDGGERARHLLEQLVEDGVVLGDLFFGSVGQAGAERGRRALAREQVSEQCVELVRSDHRGPQGRAMGLDFAVAALLLLVAAALPQPLKRQEDEREPEDRREQHRLQLKLHCVVAMQRNRAMLGRYT